jgi:hypothetical protein
MNQSDKPAAPQPFPRLTERPCGQFLARLTTLSFDGSGICVNCHWTEKEHEMPVPQPAVSAPVEPPWKRLRLTAWEDRALRAEAVLKELTGMVKYGEQHTPKDFWRFIFGEPGSGFRHASYRQAVQLLHEQIFNPPPAAALSAPPYALDSPEAEKRRQLPYYKLLVKLDQFLHKLMDEEGPLKEEAGDLHAAVHEASFQFVTTAAPSAEQPSPFKCLGRNTAGGIQQDCNWPMCGCDPYANKVIEAIEESGLTIGNPFDSKEEVSRQFSQRVEPECAALDQAVKDDELAAEPVPSPSPLSAEEWLWQYGVDRYRWTEPREWRRKNHLFSYQEVVALLEAFRAASPATEPTGDGK